MIHTHYTHTCANNFFDACHINDYVNCLNLKEKKKDCLLLFGLLFILCIDSRVCLHFSQPFFQRIVFVYMHCCTCIYNVQVQYIYGIVHVKHIAIQHMHFNPNKYIYSIQYIYSAYESIQFQ